MFVKDISMALVDELYNVDCPGWWHDSFGCAAIEVIRNGLLLAGVEIGNGYVAANIHVDSALHINSCYASPALSPAEFEWFLRKPRGRYGFGPYMGVDLIVAGYFNTRSAILWDHLI